jgi:cytochrome c biogenesis protein CcmG, thiol:disulfide interchange protein DsbE
MVATDARPTGSPDEPPRRPARRRRSRRTTALVAGIVGVVIALLVVLFATRTPVSDKQASSKLIGQRAPELGGRSVLGGKVQPGDGRWMVVNFFASWCVPCIQEHPELRTFQKEHATANDATVVSILSGEDTPAAARDFFAKRGGDWPVLTDPDGRTALDYGNIKLPESYVISPNGYVVAKFNGETTAAALDKVIADAEAAMDDRPSGSTGDSAGGGS